AMDVSRPLMISSVHRNRIHTSRSGSLPRMAMRTEMQPRQSSGRQKIRKPPSTTPHQGIVTTGRGGGGPAKRSASTRATSLAVITTRSGMCPQLTSFVRFDSTGETLIVAAENDLRAAGSLPRPSRKTGIDGSLHCTNPCLRGYSTVPIFGADWADTGLAREFLGAWNARTRLHEVIERLPTCGKTGTDRTADEPTDDFACQAFSGAHGP